MPAPRGLVQQFDQFLHRTKLLAPKQRLLIACSGGADSVALLRLLHRVNGSKFWQWKLLVGHVNHGLRGRESLADQRLVEKMAKALGLQCIVHNLRLKKHAGVHVSEATARKARLDALAAMARKHRCAAMVLAHHADDQAETVLMRILRGCSIAGLGAMRERRRIGSIHIVRPLLGVSRAALRAYLQEIGQTWREDRSNASPRFLRNRVRRELIPLLQTYQPAIRRILVRLADQAQQSTAEHHRAARVLAHSAVTSKSNSVHFARQRLRRQSNLIVGTLLRRAVQHLGGSLDKASFASIHRATTALKASSSGQRIELGSGLVLDIQRQNAVLRRAIARKPKRKRPEKSR